MEIEKSIEASLFYVIGNSTPSIVIRDSRPSGKDSLIKQPKKDILEM